MAKILACPTCKAEGPWLDGKFGMFCSERCQMVDLGRWLGEEHRITSPLTVEDLEELADYDENGRD